MLARWFLLFLTAGLIPAAPAQFKLRFLGELGQLALSQNRAGVIDLGFATVTTDADYTFTGRGGAWQLTLPYHGNHSATRVFAGDLDKDGQEDLVVVNDLSGDAACGATAGYVTLLLMDREGRPRIWQSAMQLAKTQREQEPPFLITDRNGDGWAEIAVVACNGGAPLVHSVYEVRPEGLAPVAARHWASYGGEARRLYRIKSLVVPKEDGGPISLAGPPAVTVERLSTPRWGSGESSAQVTLSDGAQQAGWSKLSIAAAGFHPVRPTGHELTDLLELLARATPVHAGGGRLLQTYPNDSAQPARVVAEFVKDGVGRERKIAMVDAAVPRNPRDASFFLAKDADCYAFHVGSGETVGAMHAVNCEAAETFKARGLRESGLVQAREASVWQTVREPAEWRLYDADDLRERRRLKLPGEGRLETVVAVDEYLMGQWSGAAGSWLTLHLADGTALTGALAIPRSDQLLYASPESGLVFLRWEGGRPVAWVEQPAHVEWRRAP